MWYQTREEALEGCRDREEIHGYPFVPSKEYIRNTSLSKIINQDYIYWAIRDVGHGEIKND